MTSSHIFTGFDFARNAELCRIIRTNITINIGQITPKRHVRRLAPTDQEFSHIGIVPKNTGLEDCTTLFCALDHVWIENFWDDNVRNAGSSHCYNLS
ncbi:MAG: nitroreductase [Caudoviricetes sp.]|nr:MAG: nitroreductase [Caudoviricetes sp.]